MDIIEPVLGTTPLLLIGLAAVVALLILIIAVKLHAFLALVLVSFATALATKVPVAEVVPVALGYFGSTLASVALLVGIGVMLGRLLEVTGGAQVLADTLVARFGERRAPLAIGVASLLFGFPIFFDAGLVVFIPIIFSVARRFGGSLLLYGLPAAGAFAVMHAFVPPHPGPVASADILGADIGLLVLVGLVIGLPTWYVASYLWAQFIGQRVQVPVPSALGDVEEDPGETPSFGTVIGLLLLPLLLIGLNTVLNTLATADVVDGESTVIQVLRLLGETPVALLITILVALAVFSGGRSRADLERICNEALGPICAIILITGAGGMFGGVLRESGIGTAFARSLDDLGLPLIVAAFVIATALRVAQGSATVALTTTAGLMSTAVADADPGALDLCFIVIAIACGSTVLSHVNDSGFWLVSRFFGMDEKTTLKTWTVMETLLGVVGFAIAAVASVIL
jgi:GntP family gluconate:H+ symporter